MSSCSSNAAIAAANTNFLSFAKSGLKYTLPLSIVDTAEKYGHPYGCCSTIFAYQAC
jgi:hypothetical protein